MVKIDTLQELLKLKEEDLKHLDTEQLQTLLGVLHYGARVVEREINTRTTINKQ